MAVNGASGAGRASIPTCRPPFRRRFSRRCATANGPPAGLSAEERRAYERLEVFFTHGLAYAQQMGQRPQTLYGIADSPVGLAAWFLDHDMKATSMIARSFDGEPEGLTRDDVLDNITITWLTNTAISGARLYWEAMPRTSSGFGIEKNNVHFFEPIGATVPIAVTQFPDELYPVPRELGGTDLSQAHPLRPEAEGRSLRRLRAAGISGAGAADGIPVGSLSWTMRAASTRRRPSSLGGDAHAVDADHRRCGSGSGAGAASPARRARRERTSSATISASADGRRSRRSVSFAPGASFPRHKHPGEEIIYVTQGTIEYEVAGKPVTVKAGEVLFIPYGVGSRGAEHRRRPRRRACHLCDRKRQAA